MSKPKPIESKIFRPGTKFIVTPEIQDSTFGPGTTGFISYVKGFDEDYRNVVFLECVISKRGKAGKNRMDIAQISTPIFFVDDEKLSSLMPDDKRRYYVNIEKVESFSPSLLDVDGTDFIGMSFAKALFLHKLNTRANRISAWSRSNEDLLNRFLNMNDFFNEDPEEIIERYSTTAIREEFIRKVRIIEATLLKCSLSYISQITKIELDAARTLLKANIGIKEEMVETMHFANIKHAYSETLRELHGDRARMVAWLKDKTLIPMSKSMLI